MPHPRGEASEYASPLKKPWGFVVSRTKRISALIRIDVGRQTMVSLSTFLVRVARSFQSEISRTLPG